MEVRVAALNTHQTVSVETRQRHRGSQPTATLAAAGHLLLDFGVLHVVDGVSRVSLSLFQVPRPHVVHPVDQIDLHVQT